MSPTPSSIFVLVLLLSITPECTPLSITGRAPTESRRHAVVSSAATDNNDDEPSLDLTRPAPISDLKALLPKPASRPLKMDKFGRRIFRMEDDNTIKLTKGSGTSSDRPIPARPRSDPSPALSTLFQNSKEMASRASSADFRRIEHSSDLKALLPRRKMTWMTLDKFGRRLQRMEDDGTVNVKKEPVTRSESDVEMGDDDGLERSSPSLSSRLRREETSGRSSMGLERGGFGGAEKRSSDLKALLPQRKMTWMKLDKLGRRVERMEDDGTVNKLRGLRDMDGEERDVSVKADFSEGDIIAIADMLPDLDDDTDSGVEVVDADDEQNEVDANEQFLAELLKVGGDESNVKPAASSSLKDLLPTKKPTWTKLDFKGGVIEDERRTKKITVDIGNTDSNLKTLLLQSKKPTWTKLDFKGGVVEDDRRMRKASVYGANAELSEGKYSNLKTLLPERKILWGSRGKVSVNEMNEYASKGPSLKALLPERKFVWRNKEIGGSKP